MGTNRDLCSLEKTNNYCLESPFSSTCQISCDFDSETHDFYSCFLETLDAMLKCMIGECNGKRSIFISMAQHTLVSERHG